MMKYEKFEIENFLEDKEFVEWVLNPLPENNAHWENVIERYPSKKKDILLAVEVLKSLNANAAPTEVEEDADRIWVQVQRLLKDERKVQPMPLHVTRALNKRTWLSIAASILVIIGIGLWSYLGSDSVEQSIEEVAWITKSIPKGKKSKITLRDGSVVTLNSESNIRYTEDYGKHIREIHLEGEAFFEVAKNADVPFVVRTKNVSTTALGTSFNISNYPEEEKILISLATGKVLVSEEEGSVSNYLDPGDHISYNRNSITFTRWHDKSNALFLWKDGIIQFEESLLIDVFSYLERWYDVEFEVDGKIPPALVYTGTFDNQSLEKVLMGMRYSLNFDYRIEENKVKISFTE